MVLDAHEKMLQARSMERLVLLNEITLQSMNNNSV